MSKWLDDKLTALLVLGGVMLLVLLVLIGLELLGAQDDDSSQGQLRDTVTQARAIAGG
jgi:hypothetical protein